MIIAATYMMVIGFNHPTVQCRCTGDGSIYENIIWESGDPIPSKASLDVEIVAANQATMWNRIKQERDSLRALGVRVNCGNDNEGNPIYKFFNSDETSRIQQLSLVMMGSNIPSNLQWKTMDNSFVTMTPTLATTIFQTTAYYDQTNFANAEIHRAAMMASNDPLNYDYSTGWLPSYNPLPTFP